MSLSTTLSDLESQCATGPQARTVWLCAPKFLGTVSTLTPFNLEARMTTFGTVTYREEACFSVEHGPATLGSVLNCLRPQHMATWYDIQEQPNFAR